MFVFSLFLDVSDSYPDAADLLFTALAEVMNSQL
jgi:hypothetical protein